LNNIINETVNDLASAIKPIDVKTFDILIEGIKAEMKTENSWVADDRKDSVRPLSNLFMQLDEIKGDCVYWYEVSSVEVANLMVSSLNDFRGINESNKSNYRRLAAKGKYTSSRIIYVGTVMGKVRKRDGLTTIASRTFQHLGFYEKGSTGALHLWYWANHSIKLNVIQLPNELSEYRSVLENLLAIKLKPVIGKHS
jgi:hypothetical protein